MKEIGRCMPRTSDNKKKIYTADLVELYSILDRKKAVLRLFVAANLLKIPGFKPLECDVVASSASLADLRQQVLFLRSFISKPEATNLMARLNSNHVQSHTDLSGKRLAGISDFGTAPIDEFSPPALGLVSSPSGSVTSSGLASDVTKLKTACSTLPHAGSTVGFGLPSVAIEFKTVYESFNFSACVCSIIYCSKCCYWVGLCSL